jgi:hypothetical protein
VPKTGIPHIIKMRHRQEGHSKIEVLGDSTAGNMTSVRR